MVYAHQGGWDEMLLVAIPIAVFALILWLANRRAQARLDAERAEDETAGDPREPSRTDDGNR